MLRQIIASSAQVQQKEVYCVFFCKRSHPSYCIPVGAQHNAGPSAVHTYLRTCVLQPNFTLPFPSLPFPTGLLFLRGKLFSQVNPSSQSNQQPLPFTSIHSPVSTVSPPSSSSSSIFFSIFTSSSRSAESNLQNCTRQFLAIPLSRVFFP